MGGPGEVGEEMVVPCRWDPVWMVLALEDACEPVDGRLFDPCLPNPELAPAVSAKESIRSLTRL